MAECRCGDPGCEHCGGGEPSTVPDRGQAFDSPPFTSEAQRELAARNYERTRRLGLYHLCRHDILREDCREGCAEPVPAFDNEGPPPDAATTYRDFEGNLVVLPAPLPEPFAVPELRASGHPVRDLADAIRAVALVHATGRRFAEILLDALALANKLDDGTHGCDTCRAALSLTKETVADLSPSAERSPPTMITATQAAP
jgi:hypothetical protein